MDKYPKTKPSLKPCFRLFDTFALGEERKPGITFKKEGKPAREFTSNNP